VASLTLLPGDGGRLEYLIQIVDPRPAAESEMPAGLRDLGAIRAVVASPAPAGEGGMRIVLLPDLEATLTSADTALGVLPGPGELAGVAGADTGLGRGGTILAGRRVVVSGVLQSLGHPFDGSVVMKESDELESELGAAGWSLRAHYLIPAESWEEREAALGRLSGDPLLLPVPESDVIAPGRPPRLPRRMRLSAAIALICCGLAVLGWQLRGLSREEIGRRLGRVQGD
jgi:hypothetical protein